MKIQIYICIYYTFSQLFRFFIIIVDLITYNQLFSLGLLFVLIICIHVSKKIVNPN